MQKIRFKIFKLRLLALCFLICFLWQAGITLHIYITYKPEKVKFPIKYSTDIEKKYAAKYEKETEEWIFEMMKRKKVIDIKYHLLFAVSSCIIGIAFFTWAKDCRDKEGKERGEGVQDFRQNENPDGN